VPTARFDLNNRDFDDALIASRIDRLTSIFENGCSTPRRLHKALHLAMRRLMVDGACGPRVRR
jgi:hypothetical protein